MKSNIVEMIDKLAIDPKYKSSISKFIGTLSFISIDNFNQINEFLNSKGIIVKKPKDFSIFCNSIDYVKNMISDYEMLGALDLLISDPSLINKKSSTKIIKYFLEKNMPIRNEKGKANGIIYHITEFNKKYKEDVKEEEKTSEENTPFVMSENSKEEISFGKPTVESTSYVEAKENAVEIKSQDVDPVDLIASDIKEEQAVTNEIDNVSEILSKTQTIPIDDETFDKYRKLEDSISRVLMQVYNQPEITDGIINNLVKLITSGQFDIESHNDDKAIIFAAITYGKNITPEEKTALETAINEQVNYENEVSLGRMS